MDARKRRELLRECERSTLTDIRPGWVLRQQCGVEWSIKLSELAEDKEKYPETEGRGPFWELLRYALRV